jgi:hypothetical protein
VIGQDRIQKKRLKPEESIDPEGTQSDEILDHESNVFDPAGRARSEKQI